MVLLKIGKGIHEISNIVLTLSTVWVNIVCRFESALTNTPGVAAILVNCGQICILVGSLPYNIKHLVVTTVVILHYINKT